MVTCKQEALRWVHRYAAGGAIFAAAPIPVSTAPLLSALETHMFSMIGGIYDDSPNAPSMAAAGGTFAALGTGLKVVAAEAVRFVPVVGPLVRGVIAATVIEGLGQAIVAHYERKYPGKLFTKPEAT
jgi:uncharacterized protein (DUF697 family)